jgi:magnesium chelatase family protein
MAQGCGRAPKCGQDYQAKISGPLFDRIDIHVEVPAVQASDLSLPPARENSAAVRARVIAARQVQADRYASVKEISVNARAEGALLDKVATPDASGLTLLTDAATRMQLTARGYHRVLKVARTLADLDGADGVRRLHVAEALSYRRLAPGR